MRERARELGGRLTIEAPDGSGVRVVAELPTLGG
jgi:signal transduction histidine kinase